MLAVVFSAVCMFLTGCGRSDEQIAADAKPVVEKILKEHDSDAKCMKITKIQKVKDEKDTYTAKAVLTGDHILNIKIEYSDDMVFVTVVE